MCNNKYEIFLRTKAKNKETQSGSRSKSSLKSTEPWIEPTFCENMRQIQCIVFVLIMHIKEQTDKHTGLQKLHFGGGGEGGLAQGNKFVFLSFTILHNITLT